MAEKRPLCQYSGTIEELRSGDSLPGGGGGSAGAIGITPEYITANKTLTSSSSGYQIVDSANSASYTLTLPDATTISEGAIMFIVQNDSNYTLDVFNDSGELVSFVLANQTKSISLEDNSSSSGIWKKTFELKKDSVSASQKYAVFESARADYISVTTLSSTQAIVCYSDVGNSYYGMACVLDISGSTITPGTPAIFESANATYISVTTLSSAQALVCYRDAGSSSYGTACILNISGSTITPGTPAVFESATTVYTSVTALSSTQALVCYQDVGSSSYGTACILNISGSTITPGTPAVFEFAATTYTSVTALSSTQAIVSYSDGGNSNRGTACILNISGSTITRGSPTVFESATTVYTSVTALSSTQALVCCSDVDGNYRGTACILDISGSTITPDTHVVFESVNSVYVVVTTLSSTQAVVCYRGTFSNYYGTSTVLSVGI